MHVHWLFRIIMSFNLSCLRPPTEPVIFYLSFMLVVYKTDSLTHSRTLKMFWFWILKSVSPGPFFPVKVQKIVQLRPRPHWGNSQRSPTPTPPLAGKGKGEGMRRKGTGWGGQVSEWSLPHLKFKSGPWFECNVCQFIVRGAGLC